MKFSLSILSFFFSLMLSAQSIVYAGSYEFYRGNGDNHFLRDYLTLNPDGTFLFVSESYIEERMPRDRKEYGKGTWTSEKQLIFLNVEESDVDAKHVLNLNNTKLRFDTKSPRDKSNRDIKTSVRIFDTEIPWLKGRTLIKGANTTPIIKNIECCKSMWQAYSYLNGKWKKNDDSKEFHFSFVDEKDVLNVYEKNDEGVLEEVNKNPATIKILKAEDGYKIEKDFDGLKTYSHIKYLDNTKLILVRSDGKESILYRIKE